MGKFFSVILRIGEIQAVWNTDISYFWLFKIQQGPLKISSVAEVMKESKQPAPKSQISKPECAAPTEEKGGKFIECHVQRSKWPNDLLCHIW